MLNIIENNGAAAPGVNTVYSNRCRFSWIGDPTVAASAWKQRQERPPPQIAILEALSLFRK